MMSTTKKILGAIILFIIAILGISTKSSAYYVGQNLSVSSFAYFSNPNMYCVEHGQRLKGYGNKYKIISMVDINGMTSTDHKGKSITNDYNAKLAYILSQSNSVSKPGGAVTNALWNFIGTWFNSVGKNHAGLYVGFANQKHGLPTNLDNTSTNYINTIKNMKIEDKTDKSKIKTTTYNKDGKEYTRVGPFKWSFSGKIKEVNVKDQNGKEIQGILYSSFNGNTENWFGKENIPSDKNFYISIPTTSGATQITTISAKCKVNIAGVKIWFLDAINSSNQNLIIREPHSSEKELKADFDYKIELEIKLSGRVWEDKQSKKNSTRNDLYKDNEYDNNDQDLEGIIVRLKDKTTGATVKETKTGTDGTYVFEHISVINLTNYYIEFQYDGLKYQNVTPQLDKNNGSKAAENATQRDNFNKEFSAVEGTSQTTGYTKDAEGKEKHQLTYNYDSKEHKSTFVNNGQYIMTSNTEITKFILKDRYVEGEEQLKNINLGLYERSMPDIALLKDVYSVKLAINNREHTYLYGKKEEHLQKEDHYNYSGEGFNVGVKWESKFVQNGYTRPIYKADYEFTNDQTSKELKAYITYEIKMINESTDLITQINRIVDYYDNKYEIYKIGTQVNEQGDITGEEVKFTNGIYNQRYNKVIINNSTKINQQQQRSIYVEFKLNREAILSAMDSDTEKLKNVAEIDSYSVFDKNGNVYAGIDKDSNPGTCDPDNKGTYEDDTDMSPGMKLETAEARTISGTVFLDETRNELKTGEVRQGSGKYEDGEKGIPGVKVTLTENSGTGKVYETTTDENGAFSITNFIPGEYTITYTWGDKTYTVQNYKGTIYLEKDRANNNQWYKNTNEPRYTDAIDDYQLRQQIDEQFKEEAANANTKISIDQMKSTTPTMDITVENTELTTTSENKLEFKVINVDFGIVERARQQIGIEKRIKSVKITLANGQIIDDLRIENGKLEGSKQNAIYIEPNKGQPANGFVKIEIDNELIQGSTLEVEYEFVVTNRSELDYITEEYYKYGKTGGQKVTLTPARIIDYLDSDWAVEITADKNSWWQTKTVEELKDLVAKDVYESGELKENIIILYTEALAEKELEPNNTAAMTLQVSKLLTTENDIELDNETEIIKVTRRNSGGSKLYESIPGNYIPGKDIHETDDDKAETVIITQSTGDNLNYIIPTAIGIIALVTIGAGIILIKKKGI